MLPALNLFFHYILFLLVSVVCFTLPGIYLLKKTSGKFTFWEENILGTVVGFVFFTLLAYLLLVFKIPFLLFPPTILLALLSLRNILREKLNPAFSPSLKLALLAAVFMVGILGQLLIISPSGSFQNQNLVFWSANGHDGAWHIALMEELKKGYPLQNPVFAGERLVNYHFFSDIAPAEFSRFLPFSSLDLYFRFFPLLYSLLLGLLAYLLGKKIGGSYGSGLWSAIFTYFGGSFGYIITWINSRTIGGESIFWATQIQSSSGNPPQIAAFVILLAFLYLFLLFIRDKSINWMLFAVCTLLAGSLVVFKVYAGVVTLGSLALVGLYQMAKERKAQILLLSVSSGLLALVLYLPNTAGSAGFLIWEPWWYIRTMIVVDSRLNWLDLEHKRQTYLVEHNLKRVAQIELTGFTIFFFGNLGTRALGLWQFFKMLGSVFNNYYFLLLVFIALSSFIFPLLFLQKGVASNTIQFMQYFLLLFGVTAAITTAQIIEKIKPAILKSIFIIFVIALTVPTQVGLIYNFYANYPVSRIENNELGALSFLKDHSSANDVILTPSFNKYLKVKGNTPPIWAWFDTAYVSAFSGRRTFLADTEQVDIMGYDLQNRIKVQQKIFQETDPLSFTNLLKENRIDYLYFPKLSKPLVNLKKTTLSKIYENNIVEIWKVN